MSRPPLIVRPVIHTSYAPEWSAIFTALGASTLTADPMWTELQVDYGRVTLTALNRGAEEGEVVLGFETPDLRAYEEAVVSVDGVAIERFVTDDYESLRVTARDGLDFLIDERLPGPPASGEGATAIQALWMTPDVERAAQDLERLGLHRRLAQADIRVIDLEAGEGGVRVHPSEGGSPDVDVALDVEDLAAAHRALTDAGIAHEVIDAGHARTLRIPLPGGGERYVGTGLRSQPGPQ